MLKITLVKTKWRRSLPIFLILYCGIANTVLLITSRVVQKAVSLPSGTYLHAFSYWDVSCMVMSIWPTQRWCTSQAAVWWVVRESVDWILFYASNFVWTSIDIITHEKWWILNLNTLKKQNMTSNWGSRIYLERKIKVSHTLVLFLIYKTLATLNVYYCFKSSLEPNSATSWSSYWEMFLFMMSMQGPSKRSKAWMSITGRKKHILIHVTDIFVFLRFTWYMCQAAASFFPQSCLEKVRFHRSQTITHWKLTVSTGIE